MLVERELDVSFPIFVRNWKRNQPLDLKMRLKKRLTFFYGERLYHWLIEITPRHSNSEMEVDTFTSELAYLKTSICYALDAINAIIECIWIGPCERCAL